MSQAWRHLDLQGAGLQAVNQKLTQHLRRPRVAYGLWLFFPLGLHRFYLHSPAIGLLYPILSGIILILGWLVPIWTVWLTPIIPAGLALYDLFWMRDRIPELNKSLRMAAYLGHGAKPPAGYQGRYPGSDDHEALLSAYVRGKESERAGVGGRDANVGSGRGAPSFAEQEKMLRALQERQPAAGGEAKREQPTASKTPPGASDAD